MISPRNPALLLRHRGPLATAMAWFVLAACSPNAAGAAGSSALLTSLRVEAAVSDLSVDLTLVGAPSSGSFVWIITDPDGNPASTVPATPATTFAGALPGVTFTAPGPYVAQVLFTSPGERVIGSATSLVVGPPPLSTPPTARMNAYSTVPEEDSEVRFWLRQSDAAALPLRSNIDFGDGFRAYSIRGRARHVYGAPGSYRSEAIVIDATGESATVFLDLTVEPKLAPSDRSLEFSDCMVNLRAAAGRYSCRDRTNPLNDARRLDPGETPNTNGCSPAPTLASPGAWRCFTPGALRRCRAYANGHRHLPAYPIRQCLPEDQPEDLAIPAGGEFAATIDAGAYLGVDMTTVADAVIQVTPSNPGAPSVPGVCVPAVAAMFGETCDAVCTQAYYTFSMAPSGPDIPVIAGLPCGSTFEIVLNDDWASVGDLHEQVAATCPVLVPGLADPPVDYETSLWTNVTGHFIWQVPRTPDNSTYTNQPYDVAVETIAVAVPVTVTCQR